MKLEEIDRTSLLIGAALGGVGFVIVSYIAHCHFGLGPWACQRSDRRRIDAVLDDLLPDHQHPPPWRPL